MLRAASVTEDGPLLQPAGAGGDVNENTLLDQEFGATTLSRLRAAVMECASAAGMRRDRAIDVMLAMHELAANVVRHGAGRGRLRMEVTAQALRCQVSDVAISGGLASQLAADEALPPDWPVEHGHGLWLVRRTADQVQVITDSDGSVVSVIFVLPG
jgi:anti-sigma regulatory factor (Ser/Thr protein kinase)